MTLENSVATSAANPPGDPPVSGTDPAKGGNPGEPGVSAAAAPVTNAQFIAALFGEVPEGATPAICAKADDPEEGAWIAVPASIVDKKCLPVHNNYFNCSSFKKDAEGKVRAVKDRFAACHALMLDDIGNKVSLDILQRFSFSWIIETSKGNHQAGIILASPLNDPLEAKQLLDAIIKAGLCDPGSSGPASRWARLPVAINGKAKHRNDDGSPWSCRLREWNPERRYTVDEIVKGLDLKMEPEQAPASPKAGPTVQSPSIPSSYSDVFFPKSEENPVLVALKREGLYKKALGGGKHDVTCPWVHEHTNALDNGTAYFEPNVMFKLGGFCCQHSHGNQYRIGKLLQRLDISRSAAKRQSLIRLVPGEMTEILDVAEKLLAQQGGHYRSGGYISTIGHDPVIGDYRIIPTSVSALTKVMDSIVDWEKFDGRSQKWIRCDPPVRHMSMLHDAQLSTHLPALSGLARQPFLRGSDGELVTQPGYDRISQRYGVFEARDFVFPEPTLEEAKVAMAMIKRLLSGFHFVSDTDRSAALAAIFTAVVRPSLSLAPGFHVRAPVYGSGKTFLCELIGAFAGPGHNMKVSYPKTSEEATKSLLALLMAGPAVVEFDDMDSDWKPHGVINRMFSSEKIADRILGVSKTVTVSTRVLFLGSGNNVGPERDLLRRVFTINIDPRCAIPAMLDYAFNPVEELRNNRGRYVAAVLTIIQAWRKAGSPKTDVPNIATYGGEWSDLCRHPLIWMGHPDPVGGIQEQIKHDPDSETLGIFMREWYDAFGSTPTTIRQALNEAYTKEDLDDAIRSFPVMDGGKLNPSKLGWFMKRNANKIVGGFEIKAAATSSRPGWAVVPVAKEAKGQPASPPLPDWASPPKKTHPQNMVAF